MSRYVTPERRDVQQIVFPNAEEAKKASERLAEGLSFDDLVKERNLTDKDIDLGTVTKADIIDPAVANAAFGLAEGAVSAPVTGRFGTAILRVVKIEPGSTKSFAEVEGEIKHDIALDRAKAEVNKIRDKVDEEFGGGTGLGRNRPEAEPAAADHRRGRPRRDVRPTARWSPTCRLASTWSTPLSRPRSATRTIR